MPLEHLKSLLSHLPRHDPRLVIGPQIGDEIGITLCGGHTEITQGLDRPIVVGQMLGEVAPAGVDNIVKALRATGIPVSTLGEVRPAGEGSTITSAGRMEPLRPADRDEIARAFEG